MTLSVKLLNSYTEVFAIRERGEIKKISLLVSFLEGTFHSSIWAAMGN